jgi:hypothetical protein
LQRLPLLLTKHIKRWSYSNRTATQSKNRYSVFLRSSFFLMRDSAKTESKI